MENKKILYVIGSLQVGGTEKQVIGLANEICKRGHNVTLALLSDSLTPSSFYLEKEISVLLLDLRFFKTPIKALRNLPKFLRLVLKEKFDVVQAFLPESVLVVIPFFLIFSPTTFRISSVRGSIVRRSKLLHAIYVKILNFSDLVVCNSLDLSTIVETKYGISNGKILFIQNAIKMPEIQFVENVLNKVAVISNFHPYKGYRTLFQAITMVSDNVSFLLMGDGEEFEDMQQLAKELEIEGKVDFLGLVKPEEYLQECVFAVHPSDSEGSSNAILEELSYGLPVIASDIPGNRSLIQDGKEGFLVSKGDAFEFAKYINRLLLDKSLTKAMGLHARKKAENFDWNSTVQKYSEIYSFNSKSK
jgi:glycosyltransferase involved in cell wall biosynthesis